MGSERGYDKFDMRHLFLFLYVQPLLSSIRFMEHFSQEGRLYEDLRLCFQSLRKLRSKLGPFRYTSMIVRKFHSLYGV